MALAAAAGSISAMSGERPALRGSCAAGRAERSCPPAGRCGLVVSAVFGAGAASGSSQFSILSIPSVMPSLACLVFARVATDITLSSAPADAEFLRSRSGPPRSVPVDAVFSACRISAASRSAWRNPRDTSSVLDEADFVSRHVRFGVKGRLAGLAIRIEQRARLGRRRADLDEVAARRGLKALVLFSSPLAAFSMWVAPRERR